MNNNDLSDFLVRCNELQSSQEFFEIEALVIGGSIGRGEANSTSDIDLFLLISNEDLLNFVDRCVGPLASFFGDVLLVRQPTCVDGFGYAFAVFYSSEVFCEFSLNTRLTLTPGPMRGQPALTIFDRTGYYTQFMKQNENSQLNEHAVFLACFSSFWLRALKISQSIMKGHLWHAISQFSAIRDQMFILARLERRNITPRIHLARSSKGVERDLDKDLLQRFSKSLCNYSEASLKESLMFSVQWFLEETQRYVQSNQTEYARELLVGQHIAKIILEIP